MSKFRAAASAKTQSWLAAASEGMPKGAVELTVERIPSGDTLRIRREPDYFRRPPRKKTALAMGQSFPDCLRDRNIR
jgi:hypothetical protein